MKTRFDFVVEQTARDIKKTRESLRSKLDFVRHQVADALRLMDADTDGAYAPHVGCEQTLIDAICESRKLAFLLDQARDLKTLSEMNEG